ncbi:hypothetical protein AVDCRST_MAG92-721 [uncultured Coleofasciculus sp.]|uniref:Uncharacterized protein n=1 Tax=uncultured Coleofasciculus sp. TaxID=1267456 RepID=A0A6J4HH04_9CYAN|nr:hypothetical protein AVDCRST_MAG92-721 [uncultured Coleofasciculus sp.]
MDTITGFQIGIDAINIVSLSSVTGMDDLDVTHSGINTLISALDKDLAILAEIQASTIQSSSGSLVFA